MIRRANCIPLQGKTVTISFWARAGADWVSRTSGAVQIFQGQGTGIDEGFLGGIDQTWIGNTQNNITINLTTSWARYSYTYSIGSTTNEIYVAISTGSGGIAGASDYFDIAGVQLEANPFATAFEIRPVELELTLCQAYYETGGGGAVLNYGGFCTGQCATPTIAKGLIAFKVAKRAIPAISFFGAASLWAANSASGGQIPGTAIGWAWSTISGFELDITVASGLVAGNACYIQANSSTAGWAVDAEL